MPIRFRMSRRVFIEKFRSINRGKENRAKVESERCANMLLCKKIKLRVTEQDAAALEFMQSKCRGLYNWWIMRLRDGEIWPGWRIAKKTLQASKQHDPELKQVYGKLLHEVYFRLDAAMQAFFHRVAKGEKPGFPRVRPRHCFFTLIYPAMYLQVEGKFLLLPTGGKGAKNKRYPTIEAELTEVPPEGFREVAICRDGRGDYYASFSYRAQEKDQQSGLVVAFDLGIKTLATGVNEQKRFYHIGGFKGGQWYNRQLDKIRSKRDKCQKKSRRYIHLSQVYKRVSQKKRNKQHDSLHKASHLIAHQLVERTVVIGDLSQRQMVMREHQEKNRYTNRAVFNDWGLYTFTQMLKYKCALYGKELVFLEERDTSKACSGCGYLQAMPLWRRTYRCRNCGLVMDRDDNSAVNILMRFLARRGPYTSSQMCDVLHEDQNSVEASGASCPIQV
jgi:putative transposase